MKKIYLLCLSIALIFILSTCKKDKPNWPTEWYVPQELLDYFYFQPNSVWVYENDKTGELDTVVIKAARKEKFTGSGQTYEVAKAYYNSFKDGYTYNYYCNTQGSSMCIKNGSKNPCYSLMCSKYKPGDYLGESNSWNYPFTLHYGGVADFSSQTSYYDLNNIYDSLKVSDVIYHNVIKVNINNALVADRKEVNIYWAKDYGIIKKEILNDSQSWNLIYSQVIK